MPKKQLCSELDWSFASIRRILDECGKIAKDELRLDTYRNQIEIITSEQMLDAYASIGMPIYYRHWSFGKRFVREFERYKYGHQNLAYELALNCLKFDTKIFTKTGIKDIIDLSLGEEIWSGTDWVRVTAKKISSGPCFNIKLKNGYGISATKNHRFPVCTDGSYVLKNVDDIKVGDILLINSAKVEADDFNDFSDFEYIPPIGGFGDKFKFTNYCRIPYFLDENLSELLGILIGDGSIGHTVDKVFYIIVGYPDIEFNNNYQIYVHSLLKKVFDIESALRWRPSKVKKDKFQAIITVCGAEIKEFLDYIGLKKNSTYKNKRVPRCIWSASTANRLAFLRGLFDTDACMSSGCIRLSCYNINLAQDLSVLLNSVGLKTSVRRISNRHNNISTIDIIGDSKRVFADLVSSSIPRKLVELRKFVYSKYSHQQANIVPKFLLVKYGGVGRIGRSSIERAIISKDKFLERVGETLGENDAWLMNFDFSPVVEIKEGPITTVVDIAVDSQDKLFVANGILTHNSSPAIIYLMEENSLVTQAVVIAHAAYGHNHYFKNNYMFRMWTDAESVIDYLVFAKNYIDMCEHKYGLSVVEKTLDACHSIMNYGINRCKRPNKLSMREEEARQKEREAYLQSQINVLWGTLPDSKTHVEDSTKDAFPKEPEENILYFLEKNSPVLAVWQREICRIVRRIAQYFMPQSATKISNEGVSVFVHHFIMNRLYDKGLLTDGNMLEFLILHTNVLTQLPYDHPRYSGLNPYYLGFEMFSDIRRICETPTLEDKAYLPEIAGQPWVDVILDIVANYRDESFIRQFLSPNLIRKLRLFSIEDIHGRDHYVVTDIHNESGYSRIRNKLADEYEYNSRIPHIEIKNADVKGDRALTLVHNSRRGRKLKKDDMEKTLAYIKYLWGYRVKLQDTSGVTLAVVQ